MSIPVANAPSPRRVEPYRPLFTLGLLYGWLGAGVWPLHALGAITYPGVTHRLLMMQGFEQCFVLGFLLTAIQGFTKGAPCRPAELGVALAAAVTFGVAALAGALRVAEGAFVVSMLLLVFAVATRLGRSPAKRPPEMMFIAFGLAMGMAGGILQLRSSTFDPFAGRLVSLGMVLSFVLGLGSLLVPTFTAMSAPASVPGLTAPATRSHKWALYPVLL